MTSILAPGLVHTPVTPFTRERKVNFDAFEKLLEFHLRNGAQALALPMHVGESVSLSDAEQRALLEFTVKQVKGRVPVIAHVSDSGTGIAVARARHAQDIGAAAIVATTPYYWTPPPAMLLEHLAQIGAAVRIPYFVFHSPEEMPGTKWTTELVLKLIDRLPNFAGVVDASLDWQFMINIISGGQRARTDFQLVSGSEYMISAGAIGARSMFSSLAGVAPRLVQRLYETCRVEKYADARKDQNAIAELRQIVKRAGFAGLKGAMRAMGRDCGEPRPPNQALGEVDAGKFADEIDAIVMLREEPRGW